MTRTEKIAWLMSLPQETISPSQLAMVDGGDPYSYNLAARDGRLTMPHLWRGRNLRIWKQPVIDLIVGNKKTADGEASADCTGSNGARKEQYEV